MLYIDTR